MPDRLWKALGLVSFLMLLGAVGALAAGPISHEAAGLPRMQTPAPSGTVVLKLRPIAEDDKASVLQDLQKAARPWLADARLVSRFAGLGKALNDDDLRRYHQLAAKGLDRADLLRLVARLNTHPAVETAFLEPVAVPAALGFDAFTGAGPETAQTGPLSQAGPLSLLNTPDYTDMQDYMNDAPQGVGVLAVRHVPGALADGLTIIDVEGAWLWSHEDLPTPTHEIGVQIHDVDWRNHGTAVMGEMRGQDNGFGVTGIVPLCDVGNASIGNGAGAAWALAAAMEVLEPGDLILVELHAPGPNANGQGQFGYVPMEYWPDVFDVIRTATARGIIVCEAAGNGHQDLDDPVYQGLFDRNVRDSGAIMCGATAGDALYSANFSNNGTRVDLNGWGWDVTTCGYGDLQAGPETEWYTAGFSGTSSASPIVTGAVAALQGMVRESLGFELDARLARDLLRETGTEMVSGTLIGTRPNLVEAIDLANTVAGRVTGIVTDQSTGQPVPDVWVQVGETGSFARTDAQGRYALTLDTRSSQVELTFSNYYYHSLSISPAIAPGTTVQQDVSLQPLAIINIRGRVSGPGGPLAGVHITPLEHSLSQTVTDAQGDFLIEGAAALYEYSLLLEGAAGHGAVLAVVPTAGLEQDAVINPFLPMVDEDFSTPGGFTSSGTEWEHGQPPAATGGAFSGSSCWGVGMAGQYGNSWFGTLTSPSYNLSGAAGQSYFLSFHYYVQCEANYDGANLEIERDGQWVLAEPLEGYPATDLNGLDAEPGWSGDSGRWVGTIFAITDDVDEDFRFRLKFGSDGTATDTGFFIDGITFGSDQYPTAVPDEEMPRPRTASLKAWPNPFNPQVRIDFALPVPGRLQVRVMDMRGRLVRTLLDAPVARTSGQLIWNGQGDDGRPVASGVYLVQLRGPQGAVATQRVVLAK
ncbi:hypothetical protein CSB20_09350 [bacterium DOLZORAL124_64_63]|nr:MAG: hypothetical protein CSB20_09350 [bacterium DOLZORAL124_64_63]